MDGPLKHYADDTIDLVLPALCNIYSIKAVIYQINSEGDISELQAGAEEDTSNICFFARTSVCHIDPVLLGCVKRENLCDNAPVQTAVSVDANNNLKENIITIISDSEDDEPLLFVRAEKENICDSTHVQTTGSASGDNNHEKNIITISSNGEEEDEHDTTSSISESSDEKEIEYFNNDICVPIYCKGDTSPLPTKEIGLLLLMESVTRNMVCSSTPLYVNKNVCFIVDTSEFSDWRDAKQDLPGALQIFPIRIVKYMISQGSIMLMHEGTNY